MIELIGQKVNIICDECGSIRTLRLQDVPNVFELDDICEQCKQEMLEEQPPVHRS